MTDTELAQVVIPNPTWRKTIGELSGEKITACYQCEKCTSGCPVAFAMDIVPHRLMRSVNLGLEDEILGSNTPWVCASCETCTTRCPNGIDIAHIMDTLRQLSRRRGTDAANRNPMLLNSEFLNSIKRHGRVHELEMVTGYTLKSEGINGLLKQTGTGLAMFLKGKLKFFPHRLRGIKQVRDIFREAEKKG